VDHASDSGTSPTLLGRLGRDPNDAVAWGEFVRRYGPKMHQWCRRWQLQDADAEDVTQNVLVEVARQMKKFTYDPARSFRGWLKTVTHGAWCDWLAAQKRPGRGSGDSAVVSVLATVEARDDLARRLEEQYDLELLDEATARVRLRVAPQTWEAFRLLTFEDLTGPDAAARLGVNLSSVYVARSRVQKLIQEELGRLEPPEEPG
jgi:RNA polymerase sigma-70 factor (ECF subfamily)